jgi:predicted ATP-dependent endonuclease of OLD family
MYITKIKVKNFRSLVNVEIEPYNYTTIVGSNDSGKSNLLRALNLFFNNQTDIGQDLYFNIDYSQQSKKRSNQAKEIEIEIQIQPPKNYSDNQQVIWKKTWREGSKEPYKSTLFKADGTDFTPRSKTEYWVRQLTYEYIPAIRGREFFTTLKMRLHNTLAETIAPKLNSASSNFLSKIRTEIREIESESKRLFSLDTEFSLPNDLGNLFEVLDLKTKDSYSTTPLQNRGDGIQGRHIPVILRFLASQRKINSIKGKPPTETIWGFEEPENNLEFSKQIEESNEFKRSSNEIQILLTTHSPAFYGAAKNNIDSIVYYASRENGETTLKSSINIENIDKNLGLMNFVQHYLNEAISQRENFIAAIDSLKSQSLYNDKHIICVEGTTDKKILEKIFSVLYPNGVDFEVITPSGRNGGANWAIDFSTARVAIASINKKTAILLDQDKAGDDAEDKLKVRLDALDRPNTIKFFRFDKYNRINIGLRNIFSKGFKLPITLEDLYDEETWSYAEKKGWLEERKEIVNLNSDKINLEKSLLTIIEESGLSHPEKTIFTKKIRDHKKVILNNHICSKITSPESIPPALKKMAEEICVYFQK